MRTGKPGRPFGPTNSRTAAKNQQNTLKSTGGAKGDPTKLSRAATNGRLALMQAREKERLEAEKRMHEALGGDQEFDGDSYELLRRVYRSPAFPIPARLDAAETCIKYERPALQAVVMQGQINQAVTVIHQIMDLCNGTGRELPDKSRRPRIEEAVEVGEDDADEPALEDEQPVPRAGQNGRGGTIQTE